MRQHNNGAGRMQPKNNEKKHNTAATSRDSFTAYTASGKRQTEAATALATIATWQPITSRRLAELMQVERCHITRCLFDLVQAGKVRVSHVAKCQVTGKRVQHYCLTSWQPELFNS